MSEVRLTADEATAVKAVLSRLVVRGRTGEIGIMHGADRFVSSQLILKAKERDALAAAAAKLGLSRLGEAK